MPPVNKNVATVRRGYELFNAGNLDELRKLFTTDAVWHLAGRGKMSGVRRGRDACFAYFAQIGEGTKGSFSAEVHDVVGGADHVVGLHTSKARRGNKRLNVLETLVFHMRRGRIAEGWEHMNDTAAWDNFWA